MHVYTATGPGGTDTLTRTNYITATAPEVVETRVITYTYDPLYRLTSAEYSTGESFAYVYDAVGNRTVLTETTPANGIRTTQYEYDAANRLTSVNGVGYTWDNNGNLLSDGVRTFTYDAANRLTRVRGGGVNATYTYNGDGLRVRSVVNGVPTPAVWDVSGDPVAGGLPQVLVEGVYAYAILARANLFTGQVQAYAPDGLGSVRLLVDAATRQTAP